MDIKSESSSVINTVLALSRYFIWQQKFTRKKLNLHAYLPFMKSELWLSVNSLLTKGEFIPLDWSKVLEYFKVEILNPGQ